MALRQFEQPHLRTRLKFRRVHRRKRLVRAACFLATIGLVSCALYLFLRLTNKTAPGEGKEEQPKLTHLGSTHLHNTTSVSCTAHCPLCAGQEADVSMTTKELNDRIEFDREPWPKSFELEYEEGDWTAQYPLRVFLVPHSHNDPGWLETVETYFKTKTWGILDTMVDALAGNPDRRFIWEEMSFLSMWWEEASPERREKFANLVRNGQIEIVGGGWVMNDEANAHYFAIIEQITEGNTWVVDNIPGAPLPRNSWAIDPFGHSPTMPYLLNRMGFRRMLIQRVHYETKKELALSSSFEFLWTQGWDTRDLATSPSFRSSSSTTSSSSTSSSPSSSSAMLCHMMPFGTYDFLDTCGPDPEVCCQFDFWRYPLSGKFGDHCPSGTPPQAINSSNVAERAHLLLDQWRKKGIMFRTNTLLVPIGGDFRYATLPEAESQFSNYERLFEYFNEHAAELHLNASFGTLEEYFLTMELELQLRQRQKEREAARWDRSRQLNSSLLPLSSALLSQLPSLSGDFFTYADQGISYWSGYYTSRPFWKAVDRVLEGTLRAAEILFTLSRAKGAITKPEANGLGSSLVSARRALALFQHHDGITGTARRHVVADYCQKLHKALLEMQSLLCYTALRLLRPSPSLQQHNFFRPEATRLEANMLPQRSTVHVPTGTMRRLVVHNSLAEELSQVVSVVVDSPFVTLLDSSLGCTPSQLAPEWNLTQLERPTEGVTRHRLFWSARAPPLGLQTYFLVPASDFPGCPPPEVSEIEIFASPDDDTNGAAQQAPNITCPEPYKCQVFKPKDAPTYDLRNGRLVATFDSSTGMLTRVQHPAGDMDDTDVRVHEDFVHYPTAWGGAYLFIPTGPSVSVVSPGGLSLLSKGRLVEEACLVLAEHAQEDVREGAGPLWRAARLFKGDAASPQASVLEMHHRLEMNVNEASDKESVVRYRTNVESNSTFYSDLNGFQTIRREYYEKIPVQGNFYPMPALAFLQDTTIGGDGGGWKGEGEEGEGGERTASDGAASGQLSSRGGRGRVRRFSVHTRQAMGVASLKPGWLEMVLDRRLTHDDGKGLGEGVMDNQPLETVLHLMFESSHSSEAPSTRATPKQSSALMPSLLSHRVGALLNYPPLLFVGIPEPVTLLQQQQHQEKHLRLREQKSGARAHKRRPGRRKGQRGRTLAEHVGRGGEAPKRRRVGGLGVRFAPLRIALPCDLHVVNLKVHRPRGKLQRGEAEEEEEGASVGNRTRGPESALLLQRRGWDCSFSSTHTAGQTDNSQDSRSIGDCVVSSEEGGGWVDLTQLFRGLEMENVGRYTLNLLEKLGEDEGGGLGARLGEGTQGDKSNGAWVKVEPMEVAAFKFDLTHSPA